MYADSMSSATIKSECKVYYIQPELFALEKTVLKTHAGNLVSAYDLKRTGLRLCPQPQQNRDRDIPCLKKYGIEHGYKK